MEKKKEPRKNPLVVIKTNGRIKQVLHCKDGKTKQQYKDSSDINKINDQARKSGLVTNLNRHPAFFADVTGIPNYEDSLNLVVEANESFMMLDPRVRERFDNDPGKLLGFLSNPKNRAEAELLGIVEKKIEPTPPPPPIPPKDGGEQ